MLNHIDPKAGIALINFSIVKARAYAWEMAGELAPLHSDQWAPRLAEADTTISVLGDLIANPIGIVFKVGLRVMRLRENHDIPGTARLLSRATATGVVSPEQLDGKQSEE